MCVSLTWKVNRRRGLSCLQRRILISDCSRNPLDPRGGFRTMLPGQPSVLVWPKYWSNLEACLQSRNYRRVGTARLEPAGLRWRALTRAEQVPVRNTHRSSGLKRPGIPLQRENQRVGMRVTLIALVNRRYGVEERRPDRRAGAGMAHSTCRPASWPAAPGKTACAAVKSRTEKSDSAVAVVVGTAPLSSGGSSIAKTTSIVSRTCGGSEAIFP